MLHTNHIEDLESSGLSEDTRKTSQVFSVQPDQAEKILAFRIGCPALAFPYPGAGGANGKPAYIRLKPDTPYQPPGWSKPAKYLAPLKSKNRLYVAPTLDHSILQDAAIDIFLTEGEKKALKAIQEGFPCLSFSGVWNWTAGRDVETGQRHVIPDIDLVVWRGRRVNLCYDSNAITNPNVLAAEKAIAKELQARGEVWVVRLPELPDLDKTGLDDFLVVKGPDALGEVLKQAEPFSTEGPDTGLYRIQDGCIGYMKMIGRGDDATKVFVPLCNFFAQVTEELTKDDGVETDRVFLIEGNLDSGRRLPGAEVTAARFSSMDWVVKNWGIQPRLASGQGAKDKLREAIQIFSQDVNERTVYIYSGWRKIGDRWVFLHGAGAIGGEGVETALEGSLSRYVLPDSVGDVRKAVKASLQLLEVADYSITFPLLMSVTLAPLCEALRPDFSLWLYGVSGSMKSTLAALFLSHFGDFDWKSMPGSWESTGNALEKQLFFAKDLLFGIDDYSPQPNPAAQSRLTEAIARVVRAQGNLSGRARMRSDTTLQASYPPRGLALMTAEDLLSGQSLMARLLTVEVEKSHINLAKLTEAQGNTGRLSEAMVAYITWLAPQMDGLKESLPSEVKKRRAEILQDINHLRTPEMLANLLTAWNTFLNFAVSVGAVTSGAFHISQR